MPEPSWTERAAAATRLDRSPAQRPPSVPRWAVAVLASLAASLAADALLVEVGRRLFPSTNGYVHFRFGDYGLLTVIGVLIAGVAWPVTVRISSAPRWLFLRMAVVVTLVLWLPDVWILLHGQPGRAVAVLMVMHLAIAVVTYNLLVRLAPARPPATTVGPSGPVPVRPSSRLLTAPVRRAGAVMGSLVVVELVLGIGTVVVVPFNRRTAWLPARGHVLYVVHAVLGGVLGLGAVALLVVVRAPRIARLGATVGFGGVLMAAAGGLASVDLGTRLLGVGLMLVGTVVAGFGYLMVAVEITPPNASTGPAPATTDG